MQCYLLDYCNTRSIKHRFDLYNYINFYDMARFTFIPIMIASALILLFRFVNQKYNPPVFGIYRQRNKYFWVKFVFMYIFLRAKQLFLHIKGLLAVELGYSRYDGTVHIQEDDIALEQIHKLGDFPLAVDAVYFNGTSKDLSALVCGIALRQDQNCDAFIYLKVNNQLLLCPELPDTRLKQPSEETEEREYKIQGLSVTNIIPMRSWRVSYNGEMKIKNDDSGKRVKVDMDLVWSAKWSAFNYDTDMSPLSMAKDLARESWTADYFKKLKKVHQTHYEQMGVLTGFVMVDGTEHKIDMPCVRDHSFGKMREWRNFHRYVLHYIYLENGDCMAIGVVSQPVVLSHLTIGYICRASDHAYVKPVTHCDLQLWHHGENQILPKDYGFTFVSGGERYDVRIQVQDEDHFYLGASREAKIYERWALVEVNGFKGWACLEWQYNNVAGATPAQ